MQALDSDTLDWECIVESSVAKWVRIPQIFKNVSYNCLLTCKAAYRRRYVIDDANKTPHSSVVHSVVSAPVLLCMYIQQMQLGFNIKRYIRDDNSQ